MTDTQQDAAYKIAIIPVTVFQQNCSLLWNPATRRAAVIDPGGEPGRILDAISRRDHAVEAIRLNPGHLEPAGGAQGLKGVLDEAATKRGEPAVPILGPDLRDQFLLEGIQAAQVGFGMTGLRNVLPDRWLRDGEQLDIAGMRLDVLHIPGHSPGHVVFVERALRFAFVGDTVFRGGVGRTDFPYGNGPELIDGIKSRLLPLGDDIAFVCGHGPGSNLGTERRENPFLRG
jgi:hydroxyacylglutathione hydrolase